MTHEGVPSEPLSDEEQDVLRALTRALLFLPQNLVADPGRGHGLSKSGHFTKMDVSEAPPRRMRKGDLAVASVRRRIVDHFNGVDLRMAVAVPSRTCATAAAFYNPERKLT